MQQTQAQEHACGTDRIKRQKSEEQSALMRFPIWLPKCPKLIQAEIIHDCNFTGDDFAQRQVQAKHGIRRERKKHAHVDD